MSKTANLLAAVAVATLALPAAADSYPDASYPIGQHFTARTATPAPQAAQRIAPTAPKDFEFVAGETGSQPVSHKLVWIGGGFAHSDECDHAIRMVSGPTADEVESIRNMSPGA